MAHLKKSSARLLYSAQNVEFRRLKKFLAEDKRRHWDIGDELVRLKDRGYKIVKVAALFTLEKNRLSEIHRTAREFPPKYRDLDVDFYAYELARKAVKEFGSPLRKSLHEIRQDITKHELTTIRDVMAHFAEKRARIESAAGILTNAERMRRVGGIINACHLGRFQDVLAQLHEPCIKVAHGDPPFANYDKIVSTGEYDGWTSQGRIQCDNARGPQAWKETVEFLTLTRPLLVPGGVVLLWQSSKPMRRELYGALDQAGLEVHYELWWDKGFNKLENPKGLYGSQCERLFVLKRIGDTLVNHAPELRRGNILRFDALQYSAKNPFKHHMFQKPEPLLEFLIRKHSYEGDLIFDAFGCSGSACIAALRLKRNWVYCESQYDDDPLKSNYTFGASRIQKALDALAGTVNNPQAA